METKAGDQATDDPEYVGRVGIAQLVVNHDGPSPEECLAAVADALEKDNRVRLVRRPDDWNANGRRIPDEFAGVHKKDPGVPLDVNRHRHIAYSLSRLYIEISVPERLQTDGEGTELVPSDVYSIVWDGMSMLTVWKFESMPKSLGPAGGRASLDVLSDAAKACGFSIKNVPCGPNCNYPMSHQEILITTPQGKSPEWKFTARKIQRYDKVAAMPPKPMAIEPLTQSLFRQVAFIGRIYAELAVAAVATGNAYSFAHRGMERLLTLTYEASRYSAQGWRARLAGVKGRRARASEQEQLLSSLSVTVMAYQSRRHHWNRLEYIYLDAARSRGLESLYGREYQAAANALKHMDMTPVNETMERLGQRFDARMMTLVTGASALIGALGGAGLTGVLGG